MVGVAGKSKACHECKIRRVKCDLEHPRCRKCAKGGIRCSGYGQKTIFINRTYTEPLVSTVAILARRKRSSKELQPQSDLERLTQLVLSPSTPSLRFRSGAFELLQEIYLPKPRYVDGNVNTAPLDWVVAVCSLEGPCTLLDYSLRAFCTAQLYASGAANVSLEESSEMYHIALRQICSVSRWDEDTRVDYILASIVILSTCEMFICPTDDGWRAHVQGIADMLPLRRGLSAMPEDSWMSLCSRLRLISTISQLTNGRRGPITSIQWAAFMSHLRRSDPIDRVVDLATDLPHLVELVTQGVYSSEGAPVAEVLRNTARKFRAGQQDLRATSLVPLYSAVPSSSSNPSDELYAEKLYPFVLNFRSLQVAGYLILSWAFQLHVHMLLFQLSDAGIDVGARISDERQEANMLARYLCQSVEYCHLIEMGAAGPQTMSYAKWIMRQFLEKHGTDRELDWFLAIPNMTGSGMRFNIKMMTFDASHRSTSPMSSTGV